MRWRAVQVKVVFLYVFAVVAFISVQTKKPLLEDGVLFIPQRDSEADYLVPIANAGNAILFPAIRSRAGMVMWEIIPRGTIGTVVFAHCSPGALAQIRTPPLPILTSFAVFIQSDLFGVHLELQLSLFDQQRPIRITNRSLLKNRPGSVQRLLHHME